MSDATQSKPDAVKADTDKPNTPGQNAQKSEPAKTETSKPAEKPPAQNKSAQAKPSPAKAKADTQLDDLAAKLEAVSGAPAHVITDENGKPVKVIMFADHIEAAFGEAISETVMHPQGNVDDETCWPAWEAEIARRVGGKLGIREGFIRANFHRTDRLGQPLEDNEVRVELRAGSERRHTLLVDPTPED